MAYRMKSSGLPFKELGSSSAPLKSNESISDSTHRSNVREIKITPKEKTKSLSTEDKDPGKIYSKSDQQLKALQQANPIATLFTGRKVQS